MTSLFEYYTKLSNYKSELQLNCFYADEFKIKYAYDQEFEGVIEPLSKLNNGEFADPKDEESKFDYIKNVSKSQINGIIKIIDERIGENNTTEGQVLILKRVLAEIEWQIKQLDKLPILNGKFSFFKNDLNHLKSQLFFKYHYLTPEDKTIEKPIITSSSKIKWNAGPTPLATMFSELTMLTTPKGDPYISSTPEELINFILSNFIGKEGEVFDKGTLGKYLLNIETKKEAKRDKVDLSKILRKED
ncbi:MAG: hypothetical protein NTZ19_01340 [Bacteroidetes bacterium]|nr:hypothetical protein [Bacteroidota bacterium]